jgi:diamine N-acetyltransferase
MSKRQAVKMASDFIIREAIIDDTENLAKFGAQSFIDTFAHLYPPSDLEYFLQEKYNTEFVQSQIIDENLLVLVALNQENKIIGYSMSGPMDLPFKDAKNNSYELIRLYISPDFKGTGLAKKLYNIVLAKAKERNSTELYLGVYCDNLRAQNFYKKLGFEIVGQYFFPVGNTLDDERIMRLNAEVYQKS